VIFACDKLLVLKEMQRHVIYGVDIIKHSEWLNDATDVVKFHHEKFDGSG
jgi:response regulator RpfG family c-di-GMP phosphodiesterase